MQHLIELVEQGIALAGSGDRADLAQEARADEAPPARSEHPGHRRRRVQAGQEPVGQCARQCARLPGRRRHRDRRADARPVRRACCGVRALPAIELRHDRVRRRSHAHRGGGARTRGVRVRARESRPRSRGHRRRGPAPPQAPPERAHAHRLPGCRRPDVRPRADDARRPPIGARDAVRVGCLAGVHGARDPVPPPCDAHLAECGMRADEDRPVPALAPGRGTRPRPPRGHRSDHPAVPRLIPPATHRGRVIRLGTECGIRLPRARDVPPPGNRGQGGTPPAALDRERSPVHHRARASGDRLRAERAPESRADARDRGTTRGHEGPSR